MMTYQEWIWRYYNQIDWAAYFKEYTAEFWSISSIEEKGK